MTKVVTFVTDIYPYCKGDVMELSKDELKRVDSIAAERGIAKSYEDGEVALEAEAEDVEVSEGEVEQEKHNVEAEKAQIERAAEANSPVNNDLKSTDKPVKK